MSRRVRAYIHPATRSSLSVSIRARFRVDYARRASSFRASTTGIVRFRRALYPSIVKLFIIIHQTRETKLTRHSSTRDATRPDGERKRTHRGKTFRVLTMTTKRATTEIRTTIKRIESTRAHCARVVEKLTASGEPGDIAVARRAKVRDVCPFCRCDSR